LPTTSRIIFSSDVEVSVQEIDQRQVRARLSVRYRGRFQKRPSRLVLDFELKERPRLADSGLSNCCDNLPMSRLRQLGGMLHRVHLTLAAHELRVAACRRALETSAQRSEPGHLIDFQWPADPFDACRPK
jgi:hypothetical protein